MKKDLIAAQLTWDNFDVDLARRVAWQSLPAVGRSTKFNTDPDPVRLIHRYLKLQKAGTNLAGCALVCGEMSAERPFFQASENLCFSIVHGYDLSEASLARADLGGTEFIPHPGDCNNLILEAEKFDLIVGHQGLHHVENLGNLFFQAHKALKPNGVLFISEWIGPEYLQIPKTNKFISLILLYALFPSKAGRTTHMGELKGIKYLQPAADTFDPSEASNSTELERNLRRYFTPLEVQYSGGLCYPIFEGIAQNMPQATRRVRWKIEAVVWIEKMLTRLGIIKPLFMAAICKKRI